MPASHIQHFLMATNLDVTTVELKLAMRRVQTRHAETSQRLASARRTRACAHKNHGGPSKALYEDSLLKEQLNKTPLRGDCVAKVPAEWDSGKTKHRVARDVEDP